MNGRGRRRKGHDFERKIAAQLRGIGIEAHRGQQGDGAHDPDVVIDHPWLGKFWLELKNEIQPSVWKAMEQAEEDCGEGRIPVVVAHRKNGHTLVCLRAGDVLRLLEEHELEQS